MAQADANKILVEITKSGIGPFDGALAEVQRSNKITDEERRALIAALEIYHATELRKRSDHYFRAMQD